MSKIRDMLHQFATTYRAESKETRKTDLDQAEKQILETHIPKSQLPSELMIEMILHNFVGISNSINTDEFGSLAKVIRELYEKKTD